MKTNKFADQVLTKSQMNGVHGGSVTCVNEGGSHTVVVRNTNDVARVQAQFDRVYKGDYQYHCS